MATDLTSARDDPPSAIRLASLDGKLDKLTLLIELLKKTEGVVLRYRRCHS